MLLALDGPQGSLHEATIYKTMRQLPLTISILARVWTRQFWYFPQPCPSGAFHNVQLCYSTHGAALEALLGPFPSSPACTPFPGGLYGWARSSHGNLNSLFKPEPVSLSWKRKALELHSVTGIPLLEISIVHLIVFSIQLPLSSFW